MKKLFLLTGIFVLMSTLTLKAQVTIGANDEPDPAAVLDLRSQNILGLLLPRVVLTDTLVADPLTAHVQGMFVYNTASSVDGKVAEGVYYNDGRRWWQTNSVDTTEPWQVSGESRAVKATSNDENIYQMGQVSIGTDTLLPITMLNVVAHDKGVMIPRLTEAQRDLIVLGNDSIANSLLIYNTDEDCYNYYSRKERAWQSLCGKEGKGQFTIDCESIQVNGTYGDGIALNSSNYLKVSVTVTKTGSYSITAVSNPDKGYFYETSGTFHSLGTFNLNIPGIGAPFDHTQGVDLIDPADDTPDQFTLSLTDESSGCTFEVDVQSTAVRPEFEMSCGSALAEGMYFEDEPLSLEGPNGPHQLKITLANVPPSAYGSTAVFETNTVDGFSFRGETVLMSSSQDVYLQGTGIPRGLNSKTFTITSNSVSSSSSCQATVHMLIPRKRLLSFGNNNTTYCYHPGLRDNRNPRNSINTLLTDKDNFGYNQWSILKFSGFDNVGTGLRSNVINTSNLNTWNDDDRDIICLNTQAMWDNTSPETLRSYLQGTNGHRKVDIVIIGYSYQFANNATRAALSRELVNFVKTGGILMIFSEANASNEAFMNIFFDNPSPAITSVSGNGAGTNYTLGFNASNAPANMRPYYCRDDDPILMGPFNNILGRNWGEDASRTHYLENLPLDSIIIYSGAKSISQSPTSGPSATGVTIFRHIEYPLIFVGDGGFNSANARSYQANNSNLSPFQLTQVTKNGHTYANFPHFRSNFGGSGNRVDNATFTANAFAWCIMQAEEYRRKNK